MHRVLKETGTIYLQMDTKINHWIRCIMDDIFGYEMMRNEIIWFYNTAPRKKMDFGKRHDTILRYTKSDNYKFNPPREPYSLSAPRGYEKEKYYHPEGKVIGDVWQMNILGQNDKKERVGYDTQKPKQLIERIITSSSDEGDIIADFYLGSGTTALVATELNRDFIGCDINPKAIEISKHRLNI
jgi:site-specific DNA-methyltransferase (adenine-specific)